MLGFDDANENAREIGIEEGIEIGKERAFKNFLELRGVETPCESCNGLGVKTYADTTTWYGGVGGQQLTTDVCNQCWGSGDKNRKGANLKNMLSEIRSYSSEIESLNSKIDEIYKAVNTHDTRNLKFSK